MAVDFLDRETEPGALERAWPRPDPVLALLWGRRRTGKTRLLGQFVEGKRAIFFAATQQASAEELRAPGQAAREALRPVDRDLLALGDFPDWPAALDYLGEQAKHERLALVLDEFPYLAALQPALPDMIQRFWDHRARTGRPMLILCGSAQAMMEDLQSRRGPLFGRATLRIRLQPLGHREAALFLPRLPPPNRPWLRNPRRDDRS
jgi:AAA+ ATPase superfamily predicted ATPase